MSIARVTLEIILYFNGSNEGIDKYSIILRVVLKYIH